MFSSDDPSLNEESLHDFMVNLECSGEPLWLDSILYDSRVGAREPRGGIYYSRVRLYDFSDEWLSNYMLYIIYV